MIILVKIEINLNMYKEITRYLIQAIHPAQIAKIFKLYELRYPIIVL